MSEEFGATIEEKRERTQNPKFRRTEFLELVDGGERTIRILDKMETKHYTHYMGWAYIKCLGDECPICQNNRKILYEHPTDYRDVKGWNARRDRYYINVLDRTKSKVCPKCDTVSVAEADLCSACGTVLGEAKPLDKVVVLSGSAKLFEDLKVLSRTIKDENEERVDIRAYDWLMLTRGKKQEKVTTPSPRYFPSKAGLIDLHEGQELFDLENAVVTLTPEEMLEVSNGTSLKDVFAMRRTLKKADAIDRELSGKVREDLKASLDEIFPNI